MGYKIKGERKRAPGAGRKPKAITLAKNALIANKIAVAERAFAFQEALMEDATQPIALRDGASKWLWENVYGKATSRVVTESSPEQLALMKLYYESLKPKEGGQDGTSK